MVCSLTDRWVETMCVVRYPAIVTILLGVSCKNYVLLLLWLTRSNNDKTLTSKICSIFSLVEIYLFVIFGN